MLPCSSLKLFAFRRFGGTSMLLRIPGPLSFLSGLGLLPDLTFALAGEAHCLLPDVPADSLVSAENRLSLLVLLPLGTLGAHVGDPPRALMKARNPARGIRVILGPSLMTPGMSWTYS